VTDITQRLTLAIADRYRIERHLGEGGMATVYLAEDIKHQRKVALKVLRPELAAVIGADRFVQEITTTASLQHPHILPLFDSGRASSGGEGGEFLYYVMPYVEGETLRDKLNRETQLGIDEAVRITSEVADALDYAHRHGIIHRDIKPENILLHDGRPMVADFGIALALSAAAGGRMTETGLSLGTPHYMSPEQATADKHVTNRSDIYSLGCMLYEMLTGEPPHTGASAQAIIMKIVTEPARSVTSLRKSVPPYIAAATAKALEKLPADRFESAKAFADALHNTTFGVTVATTQHALFALPTSSSRGRTLLFALGGVAVAAIALAAWGFSRTPAAPVRNVTRYKLPLPIEVGLGNDFGNNIALSPDGTRFVYATAVDGTPKLWMLERNQLEPKAIAGTDQAHQPFFSPDGKRIAFITWDRKLKIVSLGGEPPTTLLDSGLVRGGGAWGEDGYIYLSGGSSATGLNNRGLERVPALGGRVEAVTGLDSSRKEVAHRFPVVLPGGRGLVFVIYRERLYDPQTAEIGVVDLTTGKHHALLQGTMVQWSPTGHLVVVRADGALVAVPFDHRKLELTGSPTPLLDGVNIENQSSSDIALSASGSLIYEPASTNRGSWQLAWVTRDGQSTPVDPSWTGRFRHPSLSPDGKRVAVTNVGADNHIWIKQLDRGPNSKLTFEGNANIRPAWLPDGLAVAYISDVMGATAAFTKKADGSAPAKLAMRMPEAVQEIDWARDGSWAAVRVGSSPRGHLFAFKPGVDTVAKPLFASQFDEAGPALSPDHRWIAYSSTESGPSQIFVRPFPDASSAKWQVSTKGGTEPLWAHSGRELFYRDGDNQLVSVATPPGTTFTYGEQKTLFSAIGTVPADAGHRMYDISPDDKRFLMIRTQSAADLLVPLIVVDNFLTELRQKVAAK
jgi:Tol biopolymer transport system component